MIAPSCQVRPSEAGASAEDAVDRFQDRLGRAEGKGERHLVPGQAKGGRLLPEGAPDLAEPRRVGTLEGIDRLLLVAHGEQRAQLLAGARAGEELRRQSLDDAPLRRVGILRLVHQDMVDAAVDLVEHPGGRVGAGQQVLRLDDQIVIVERGLGPLAPLVIRLYRVGEREHRGACFGQAQMRQPVAQIGEARLCLVEHCTNRGDASLDRLAANSCAHRPIALEKDLLERNRTTLALA